MIKVTKRSLWGYDPDSVERATARLNADHEAACSALRSELDRLRLEHAEWEKAVARLRRELEAPDRSVEMAKQLLEEHYAATEEVLEAKRMYDDSMARMKSDEAVVAEKQESALSRIKSELGGWLEEKAQSGGGGERHERMEAGDEAQAVRPTPREDS
ncbi:hypothetical protein FE782_11770 [Paenibacillus antri]|uniref:Uncharacterized protein n=1 Tax=Paenibacillus antri TaxID=2582848 RepID=A0A5R9G6M3_9BACL|nr:hypothetical protein [Paenibacillus antri]TLS52042.1 hypothetical protein FE782_11770 [Paenibacillus antri]